MPTPPGAAAAPAAPWRVLPAIVLAQLLGTSPWFAVNAVMPDLQAAYGWPTTTVATLTSALQGGFIVGTLVFALLALSDRFSARRLFLVCALAASLCTLGALLSLSSAAPLPLLWSWRALTGFFLAGIYPVGMKLAAQWFPRGLGSALGWLVGALVLGSASPHALRGLSADAALQGAAGWAPVFIGVAGLSAVAGLLVVALVPDPPAATQPAGGLRLNALASIWRDARVRASAFGYFGHMVELYTVWVLMPLILATRIAQPVVVSWSAFLVLGAGALGCIGGGLVARHVGSARVAGVQLAISGLCCLLAPWMLTAPYGAFVLWLLVWGITVAGDSPQFSALTAANAPRDATGSVLTLVNCIGFAISVVSIEVFVRLAAAWPLAQVLPFLALGPALGLIALRPLLRG
jgi:MFS transporter, DHA1 family, inner membrane transport protein